MAREGKFFSSMNWIQLLWLHGSNCTDAGSTRLDPKTCILTARLGYVNEERAFDGVDGVYVGMR